MLNDKSEYSVLLYSFVRKVLISGTSFVMLGYRIMARFVKEV